MTASPLTGGGGKEDLDDLLRSERVSTSPAPIPRRLLASRLASAYLGIAERTLRTWTALGRVPVVRLGRTVRYDVRDLDALIERAKVRREPPR